jgi:Mg2+ and Co2+ transporter CorA
LNNNQNSEALVFGQYLIGQTINDATVERYNRAIEKLNYQADEWEQAIVEKAVRKPSLIPYYDAAMALRHRNALLRKKIFVMLAILETRPEYADYFLSKEYPKSYFLNVIGIGVRSVYRAVVGLLIYRTK